MNRALSVPENTGRRGRYKTALRGGDSTCRDRPVLGRAVVRYPKSQTESPPKAAVQGLWARRCAILYLRHWAEMRSEGIQIGKIYGIPIFLHPSWFFVFGLIAFSFVSKYEALNLNIPESRLWGLGLMTSVLFFGSLVFHEMAHSVIAKHYKIPVVSITLFIFGGVARISRDPSRAIEEFYIAVAGPLSSFLLAGGFGIVYQAAGTNVILQALAGSLAWINLSLALFNLLPGFPLDGGRIFRAIVWGITKDYSRSTRIAARSGQVVAYGMIALGAVLAVSGYVNRGDMISGMWLAFIGWVPLTTAPAGRGPGDGRGG